MKINNIINKLKTNSRLTVTPLRLLILKIILKAEKPLGAYDILRELRITKPKAEPPTVYRVLDYLIENKIVHRIEANNTYYFCQHKDHESEHLAQLLICTECGDYTEVFDQAMILALQKLSELNAFSIEQNPIEIYGICQKCAA